MIINSSNGWDSLEEIIVGRADFANVPPVDPSMKNFMYANLILISKSMIADKTVNFVFPTTVFKKINISYAEGWI